MRRPQPDFSEGPLISPRESVRKRARRLGLKLHLLRLPKTFLLSLNVGASPLLVKETGARRIPWIYGARPLYVGKVNGTSVGVIWAAPGAPLATVVMEDLVACGVRKFVGVGSTGAIQPFIDVGDYCSLVGRKGRGYIIPLPSSRCRSRARQESRSDDCRVL